MSMKLPIIRARAKFEHVIYAGKTPKYRISHYAGSSDFLQVLRKTCAGRDGNIYVYLKGELETVAKKGGSADLFLQVTRNKLRLTGLYLYFKDKKPSGYACGNPLQDKTFTKDKTPNPLYEYRADGYLFKFEESKNSAGLLPNGFEWVVLQGAGVERLKDMYLRVYNIGGFDEALKELPLQEYTI